MDEKWLDVLNYENYFMVSNKGAIFSKRSNKKLKLCYKPSGYVTFATKIGGRLGVSICFKVHRLVAQAFIPNPLNKKEVNHIDGNKHNNNVENLEWVTSSENRIHACTTGLVKHIPYLQNNRSKLNKEDIEFIYTHYKPYDKKYSATSLGKMFCVDKMQIIRAYRRYEAMVLEDSITDFQSAG